MGILAWGACEHIFRPACKPHSVQRGFPVYTHPLPKLRAGLHPGPHAWAIISLSSLPGTYHPRRGRTRRAASRPCLALLPAGVAWPPALLRTPVVSYTTFSPLPPPLPPSPNGGGAGGEGGLFLWPCSGRSPHPGISPAPCPMECGLSSIPCHAWDRDRPASLKTKLSYRL